MTPFAAVFNKAKRHLLVAEAGFASLGFAADFWLSMGASND
jgi:hypothetical protein